MNNKLKALSITVLMMMSIVMLVLASAPAGASASKKAGTVLYGTHEEILVGSWTTATSLHFTVTSNATIDVYVLTASESINYPTGNFNAVKAVENTKSADFTIKSDSTNSYYLIIDNEDNSKSTDALPTGDASYSATYPNFMDIATKQVDTVVTTCLIGAISIIVIIIVVVIVLIYFIVIRKKPQPPVVQSPYGAQPVQYQQPVYQTQPQAYSPPAPSPYEPPPPPPQQGYSQQPPAPPGQQYPPR